MKRPLKTSRTISRSEEGKVLLAFLRLIGFSMQRAFLSSIERANKHSYLSFVIKPIKSGSHMEPPFKRHAWLHSHLVRAPLNHHRKATCNLNPQPNRFYVTLAHLLSINFMRFRSKVQFETIHFCAYINRALKCWKFCLANRTISSITGLF